MACLRVMALLVASLLDNKKGAEINPRLSHWLKVLLIVDPSVFQRDWG